MYNRLVCNCAQVFENDIKELVRIYGNMSYQNIKTALNIGNGCGQCTQGNGLNTTKIENILNIKD